MSRIRVSHLGTAGLTLLLIYFVLAQDRLLGKLPDSRDADREAINGVLHAQQEAWNRGDVDAFLVGYWQSLELTFSGTSGVSRG